MKQRSKHRRGQALVAIARATCLALALAASPLPEALAANQPPVAYDQRLIVPAGMTSTQQVVWSDPDARRGIFRTQSEPVHGTLSFGSSGTYQYTPNEGFAGEDSFTWVLDDDVDASNVASVRFLVRPVGDRGGALVALVVQNDLFPEISAELARLTADLENEGYTTSLKLWSSGTSEELWAYLRSEYTNESRFMEGALLVGYNLPLPKEGDGAYWHLTYYDPGNTYRTPDIWVSRFASADARQLRQALDSNHHYRTGQSRLPDTYHCYRALRSDYPRDQAKLANFLKVWTATSDLPNGSIEIPMTKGAELVYRSDEYSPATGPGPFQCRFCFVSGCNAGRLGDPVSKYQYTPGGANLFSVGSIYPTSFGCYAIDTHLSDRVAGLLNGGESWGSVLCDLSRTRGEVFRPRGTIYYGDLSVAAKMSSTNTLPHSLRLTASTRQLGAGQPLTLTVSFLDPDNDASDDAAAGFQHQVEWFLEGYDGNQDPTYLTDDTLADWTRVTHTYSTAGTYRVRAEVMDRWRARSWTEITITVTPSPDRTAPHLNSVASCGDPNQVTVAFSETVELASSQNLANYSINNHVSVTGALLQKDGRSVRLATSPLFEYVDYVLTVAGVTDASPEANPVAPGTAAMFRHVGLVPGVAYDYYEGSWDACPDFSSLAPKKSGTVPSFSLAPRDRASQFAFSFNAFLWVSTDDPYTFYVSSDDGGKLSIDGILVVEIERQSDIQEQSGTVALARGFHQIAVAMLEQDGDQQFAVQWQGPGIGKQRLPDSALYCAMPAPATVDEDGDDLVDNWEIIHFGGTHVAGGGENGDADNDGFCDRSEYLAGTDPNDSLSALAITRVTLSGPGSLVIKWPSTALQSYSMICASNLMSGSWEVLQSNILAVPPMNSFTVPVQRARSFYRIKLEP